MSRKISTGPSMVAMIYLRACSYGGSAMITPTPLAHRVARRHQAAVALRDVPAPSIRVEYSNSGRSSAVALMKMLEPQVGKLVKLRFRRSLAVDPNGVEWEALNETASVVTGKLVLHAALDEDEVISWAEVTVDPSRTVFVDPAHLRLIEPAAERVAREYQRRGEGLVPADGENDDEDNEAVDDEGEQVSRTVLVDPDDLRLIEPADPIAERVAREYIRRGETLMPVDDAGDEPVDDDGEDRR
jgi:hypothetical protein